jgi:hypothetical protein
MILVSHDFQDLRALCDTRVNIQGGELLPGR